MIFYSYVNKTHFHNISFAFSLVLKVIDFGTQKWPIQCNAVQCNGIKCNVLQYSTIHCNTKQCFALHYNEMKYKLRTWRTNLGTAQHEWMKIQKGCKKERSFILIRTLTTIMTCSGRGLRSKVCYSPRKKSLANKGELFLPCPFGLAV